MIQMYYDFLKQQKKKEKNIKVGEKKNGIACYYKKRMDTLIYVTRA